MKKIACLALILFLVSGCGQKQKSVDRIFEDGVEVVLNHMEPYKIGSEASKLILEQEMTIDTENDATVQTGLVDIETFDVDDDGDLFFIRWSSNENFVYKFDSSGTFVKSFVRRGQGPGEIEWGGKVVYIGDNQLKIRDPGKIKYSVYDTEGEFVRDENLKFHVQILRTFRNGKHLVYWQDSSPSRDRYINHLALSDSENEDVKEIFTYSFPNVMVVDKVSAPGNFWIEGTSKENIFVGDGELGYEILVFDIEGDIVRKIRKEYTPVELSDEYKQNFFERIKKSPYLNKYELRKHFPPFQYLFSDPEGRIYVMSYEKGASPNEWIFDIFNPEGVFVARVPIKSRLDSRQIAIRAKHGRIYSLCEKESGFKELVVYRMLWE
jgi:hypothetical protein